MLDLLAGMPRRRCCQECRAQAIIARIAGRAIESRTHLGCHRRVLQHTFAWLARYCRLTIRHQRRADIQIALTTLARTITWISEA